MLQTFFHQLCPPLPWLTLSTSNNVFHICSNHILHTDSHISHDSWECFLRDIAHFPANVVHELIKRPWSRIGINSVLYRYPQRKKSQVGLSPGSCTTCKCRRKLRWIWTTHFVSCHHITIFVLWFTVNFGIFYAWWWLPKHILGLPEWEQVG